jgi:hypothetical protein
MKRIAALTLTAAVILLSTALVATAASSATRTGEATQRPCEAVDKECLAGTGIHSNIDFIDTGSALIIFGVARELDPSKKYFSLLYDNGSKPSGPNACVPSTSGPPITDAQMFVGFWDSATGVLSPDNPGNARKTGASYAALGTFATISIRQVIDPTKPPSPQNQHLVACGRVRIGHRL